MIASRASYYAVLLLFFGKLRDLKSSTTHLEGAGHLQILGLKEYVGFGIDLLRRDELCAAHHVFQYG